MSPGIPPTAPILAEPNVARVHRISELEFASRALGSPMIVITLLPAVLGFIGPGIDRFGVSAPAKDAYDYFGLTPGKIAERVTDFMKTRNIA